MPGAGDMMGGGGGQPPLPPTAMPSGGGTGSGPTFAGLAGQQQGPQAQAQAATPGASQTSGALVRLAMEIDQALKLLAQAAPQLAPWVDQTTQQLRSQVGIAISQGASTNANPAGQGNFPGGGANLT